MKPLSLMVLSCTVLGALIYFAKAPEGLDAGTTLPPVVFVSRNPLPGPANGDVPGLGPVHRTGVVGGKLMIRYGNGRIGTIVDSTRLIDVADPCVSFDGTRILFSGIQHADSNWRIFEVGIDGSGFRQLTLSDRNIPLDQFGEARRLFVRYDDFDPCYLPEGKIVFASTRYPSMAMIGNVRASNLYVMEGDGSGMHRITSERSGGEEPTIDPVTGQIVYSRWWLNIDLPSNATRNNLTRERWNALSDDIGNIWHAIIIRPDGTELKLYAGFARRRSGMQTYKPSVMQDGKLLSVYSPNTGLVPDAGGWGVRWFNPGADFERHIAGVRPWEEGSYGKGEAPPFATDPVELGDGRILFAYSLDGSDYGIFESNLDGTDLRPVIDLPGTLELEPQVVMARPLPPVIKQDMVNPVSDIPPTEDPETYARNDFFRFDCMNVFTNGKVDEPMPDAPRIGREYTIQFFLNAQRQSTSAPDPSILLKTAPVFYNGGIHEHDVPAEVPLFEQIVDAHGNVVETTDGKFAHVAGLNFDRQGAGTKCVGCHIGHSMLPVPPNGSIAEWFNVAPSARVTASSEFKSKSGILFASRRIVDRQARTGGDSVMWIANESEGAHVTLHWPVPVEARQFILYNITPPKGSKISVQDSRILLYYRGIEVGRVPSTGALSISGTPISIQPTRIDSARIIITKVTGTLHGRRRAGLAEVETIARLFPNITNN